MFHVSCYLIQKPPTQHSSIQKRVSHCGSSCCLKNMPTAGNVRNTSSLYSSP